MKEQQEFETVPGSDDFIDLRMAITDFQNRLTSEMKKAETKAVEAFVAVFVEEDRWLLDLKDLKSMELPAQMTRIGMTKPWTAGIANFRGTVQTVVDMRALLTGRPAPAQRSSIITLLAQRYETGIGLLWPGFVGMVRKEDFLAECPTKTPADQSEFSGKWVKSVRRDRRGLLWKEMDVAILAASEEMLNLAKLD